MEKRYLENKNYLYVKYYEKLKETLRRKIDFECRVPDNNQYIGFWAIGSGRKKGRFAKIFIRTEGVQITIRKPSNDNLLDGIENTPQKLEFRENVITYRDSCTPTDPTEFAVGIKDDTQLDKILSLLVDSYLNMNKETDSMNKETDSMNGDTRRIAGNILFYGVPGSGKSYKIKTEYCNDENFMERVVFHPDYTYSDFVGQILPQNNEGRISYSFTVGPFSKILRKAYRDTENNYFLIIEELNRGNAPAIFGDVFQLLDRNENGESEYGINNSDIAEFVYGDKDEMVKIPSNLFILATMNTADQNVFTLDTAFKRRWKMCCVCNDVSKCNYVHNPICNTEITWKSFLETINKTIVETAENNIGVEDKRLGVFFVGKEELQSTELFGEKVLMYLWTDVFKFNHEEIFKEEYKTLEDLLKGFQNVKFGIFNENIKFEE